MSSVLVVQVIVDEIVGVVSVRDGFVAAGRAVFVARVVRVAVVPAIAVLWIRARNWEDVFVDVRLVDVVQVSVMQIVDVSFMENGDVSASRRVRMAMIVVRFVFCHRWPRLVGSTSYLNCPHEGSTIGGIERAVAKRRHQCGTLFVGAPAGDGPPARSVDVKRTRSCGATLFHIRLLGAAGIRDVACRFEKS
jgi:hypothetical protein